MANAIVLWLSMMAGLSSDILGDRESALLENCSYWSKGPYKRALSKVMPDFKRLDEEYDLRCCPKPNGPIHDLGIMDPTAALEELSMYDDSDWLENTYRQNTYQVHSKTQSILFLWKQKFFDKVQEFPRWQKWEPLFAPAIQRFAAAHNYSMDDLDIWKAMLARIPAGLYIEPHQDVAPALAFVHRLHWALVSDDMVTTAIGGVEMTGELLGAGRLFEFNNVRRHKVHNAGKDHRIHAVLDIVPKKMKGLGRVKVTRLMPNREL